MIYQFSVFAFSMMVVNVYSAEEQPKCAMKNLELDQLVGEWKYEASLDDAPSELKNSENGITLRIVKDGKDGIKIIPVGFEGQIGNKYKQLDAKQPAVMTTELMLENGEKLNEKLVIADLIPARYLLTYSPLMKSWGLFVSPTVSKLVSSELKKLARKVKCLGGKFRKFLAYKNRITEN